MIGPFRIGFMDALVALLLAEFIVAPLSTLGHEARARGCRAEGGAGKVTVVVGRESTAIGIEFDD